MEDFGAQKRQSLKKIGEVRQLVDGIERDLKVADAAVNQHVRQTLLPTHHKELRQLHYQEILLPRTAHCHCYARMYE